MALSAERKRRVLQAIGETQILINKEMRYSAALRNYKAIEVYSAHIVKLNRMLTEKEMEAA